MDADRNSFIIMFIKYPIRVYPCPSVEYTTGTKEQPLLVGHLGMTFRSMSSALDYPNRSACVPVRSNITSCLVLL